MYFSKENNIETVAEYVEDEKTLRLVRELGISHSQGYYFSKAHPMKHFQDMGVL